VPAGFEAPPVFPLPPPFAGADVPSGEAHVPISASPCAKVQVVPLWHDPFCSKYVHTLIFFCQPSSRLPLPPPFIAPPPAPPLAEFPIWHGLSGLQRIPPPPSFSRFITPRSMPWTLQGMVSSPAATAGSCHPPPPPMLAQPPLYPSVPGSGLLSPHLRQAVLRAN